jgi:membrane-bound lytic murein transglycosylase B
MGMPQFMPSSMAKYAVDFDGDGRIDLVAQPADVIGSVASYFKGFGWQPGMPRHYPVHFDEARLDRRRCCWRPTSCRPSACRQLRGQAGAVLEGEGLQHKGRSR